MDLLSIGAPYRSFHSASPVRMTNGRSQFFGKVESMQIRFAFGRHGLDMTLPEGPHYEVIESRSASPLQDVASALDQALDHPIGGKPLADLAAGKKTAAISVCDITRPAPNWLTLPPVLKRLHAAGIPIEGVTLLIATGLHREATPSEIEAILGPEIAARYRVVNHDARALTQHRWLGETRRGIPVYIDERFMAAELHITLGFIEQHLMLGFSGGRKLVAPGLAAQETIKVIHSPLFMREPMATEGSITHNPLHAELLEIARMARHDFMLDVTLTQSREVSGIFAGDPVEAHAAGVDFLRVTSLEKLSGLADVVITSAAGHPLDLTFYQTIKGLTAAQHIVKPGGRILIMGECAEGVGSPEFAEKVAGFTDYDHFLAEIGDAPVVVDQWQLEKLALAGQKYELFFFMPGVPRDRLGSLAARCYETWQEATAAVLAGLPKGSRVALVPEGPYVYARVPEEAPDAREEVHQLS
jgi:nickel-dependent lactate racemase